MEVAPTAQSIGLLADGNDEEGWKDWGGLTPMTKGATNVGATAAGVVSFRAEVGADGVRLSWATALEPGNMGFHLYRSRDEAGAFERTTSTLVQSRRGMPFGDRYSFLDPDGREGDWYLLEDLDAGGSIARHPAVRASAIVEPAEVSARLDLLGESRTAGSRSTGAGAPGAFSRATIPRSDSGAGAPDHLNLSVTSGGIFRIDTGSLSGAAGTGAGRRPGLSVTDSGRPVPVRIRPGKLPGDPSRLEFYATAPEGRYASEHVYQLRKRDDSRTREMSRRTGRPVTDLPAAESFVGSVRYEENRIYYVASTESDHFFYSLVFNRRGPEAISFPSDSLGDPARLRGDLVGVTEAPGIPRNHHVLVRLNGVQVYEGFFAGTDSHRFDVALPPGLLAAGNQIEFEAAGGSDGPADVFLVNWFEVESPRLLKARANEIRFEGEAASRPLRITGFSDPDIALFDVTRPADPAEIRRFRIDAQPDGTFSATFQDPGAPAGPRKYLAIAEPAIPTVASHTPPVEADLKDRSARGDYLVVTVPELHAALQPLLDYRRGEGFDPRVVDVDAIYDQFGGGNKSPEAIRAFVGAAASWSLPPRYLLLAGGASLDPRGFLGTGWRDLVPAKLAVTRRDGYEAAGDGYFVSGLKPGALPISVGRLPAQDGTELSAAVQKILEYETGQAGRPLGRALFIADDRNARSGLEDPSFAEASRALAEGVADTGVGISILNLADSADPRADLDAALAAGVDLVNFMGHGGPQVWTSQGILTSADAAGLPNGPGSYFAVFSMTCFDGAFTFPYGDSLAWSLVKAPGRGAVAAYSPSTILDPRPHSELDRLLLDAVYRLSPSRIGDRVREVESDLSRQDTPEVRDMIDTFNLIGDPAMRLGWSPR